MTASLPLGAPSRIFTVHDLQALQHNIAFYITIGMFQTACVFVQTSSPVTSWGRRASHVTGNLHTCPCISSQTCAYQVYRYVHAGMHLARNHADPDYRTRGAFGGPHMVAFTSEHAHYSYLKAAFLTGAAAVQINLMHCESQVKFLGPACIGTAVHCIEKQTSNLFQPCS